MKGWRNTNMVVSAMVEWRKRTSPANRDSRLSEEGDDRESDTFVERYGTLFSSPPPPFLPSPLVCILSRLLLVPRQSLHVVERRLDS